MSRQPAPTALKLLKGVRPSRINENEPKPRSHSGAMPPGWGAHMSDGAKRFWKRYAPILSETGVLTEADLPALRVLCELWSRWTRYINMLNKGKLDPVLLPRYEKMTNTVESQMRLYLNEFGMTGSSRGKITTNGHQEEEPDYLD